MTWRQAQEKLAAAWPSLEGKFEALCYICQADEAEFGCEARAEDQPVFGRLRVLAPAGEKSFPVEEARLFASGFYDRMWAGWTEKRPVLLTEKEKLPARAEDLLWLAAQLEKEE